MTIILGIDPGTRITGYGLIRLNGSSIEPIDFGCIRPPATLSLAERYRILFEALEMLLERHKPASVAVESQFVLKNAQSALKLGGAKAMVLLAAARLPSEVHEYTPKKAKLAVVGNGNASKTQVQRMIATLLRLKAPPEPEDAADALALAICHAHNLRTLACLNTSKAPLSIKSR
ncbi:MAG TPA: crossover junction endodeoxyribonuclease RuvC [Chlamydiales bacterium]|jgi:crossover junction endodeoxyribonuclease RuvC